MPFPAAFRTVPVEREGQTFEAAQIYTCQADAAGALSFGPASAPDAGLVPLGPVLTSDEALDLTAPARPGSIADLRVRNVGDLHEPASEALPFTVRAINGADFVLRLRTRDGLRPTGPCSFVGEQVRSPYFAEYYFVSVI